MRAKYKVGTAATPDIPLLATTGWHPECPQAHELNSVYINTNKTKQNEKQQQQ